MRRGAVCGGLREPMPGKDGDGSPAVLAFRHSNVVCYDSLVGFRW